MIIQTSRFGEVEISEDLLVTIPEGLLGFESEHEYCIIVHAPNSPFRWLQSITRPDLAFVTVDPFNFFTDYDFDICDSDVKYLELSGAEDVVVMTIVTIAGQQVSTNLVGPIVINRKNRMAKQIVLPDPRYGTRHSLLPEPICTSQSVCLPEPVAIEACNVNEKVYAAV